MAVQDQPGLNPVDSLVIDRPEVVARLREDRGRGGPAQGDELAAALPRACDGVSPPIAPRLRLLISWVSSN